MQVLQMVPGSKDNKEERRISGEGRLGSEVTSGGDGKLWLIVFEVTSGGQTDRQKQSENRGGRATTKKKESDSQTTQQLQSTSMPLL